MLIILEGCDGVGKTTFAQTLHEELCKWGEPDEVVMRSSGPFDGDPLDEYIHRLKYMPNTGRHVIADRWHWGELVYGPIFRKMSRMTVNEFKFIEQYLNLCGALVVSMTLPKEVIVERLKTRGDDMVKAQHVDRILRGYARVREMTMLPYMNLDVIPIVGVANHVIELAQDVERSKRWTR